MLGIDPNKPKSDYRPVPVGCDFVDDSCIGKNESQTHELSDLEEVGHVQAEREEMTWTVHQNRTENVYDEAKLGWKGADQGVDWWEKCRDHADRALKPVGPPEVTKSYECSMQGRRRGIDRQQQLSPTLYKKEMRRVFRLCYNSGGWLGGCRERSGLVCSGRMWSSVWRWVFPFLGSGF